MKNIRQNRPQTRLSWVLNQKQAVLAKFRTFQSKISEFFVKRPVISFFSFLGILLIVIFLGDVIRAPKTTKQAAQIPAKEVSIFGIGASPKVSLSGRIEKSGVVHVIAQSAGIVSSINVQEGAQVYKGTWLVGLSSNYQGYNISALSREIAQKNVDLTNANFQPQLDLISKQRDLADKANGQVSALRDIANASIGDTQNLITVNQDLLSNIQSSIDALPPTSTDSAVMATILQMKQAKSGVLSGLLSLQAQLRNAQYQASGDHEPAKIADLTKDMTLQQLDIQERSVRLGKEIAELNLRIAQASEAFMYPASPVSGVVERINVQIGQAVSPGTPIATITGNKNTTNLVVRVSRDMAQSLSRIEPSTITVAGKAYDIVPRYISTEPTDGSLFTVLYTLPDAAGVGLSDQESIRVDAPVGKEITSAAVPFVPLDAVYQTQDAAYLYVASGSANQTFVAVGKTVTLGEVMGSFVRVISGISANDQVIVSRTVVDGDPVTFK
jgi:HlyD family secretion protein